MADNKKKKNGLWSKMKKVVKTKGNDNPIKNQTGYRKDSVFYGRDKQ